MFSLPDDPPVGVAARSSGPAPGPWPIGVRVLLTALGLVAALGLRLADRGVASGVGAACKVAPRLVIDPNTAPPGVLAALPHVGPALVRKLIEQRQVRPFASMGDMRRRVRGLGPATLARLGPYLRIGPPGGRSPGPQNTADLPGPDGTELAQASREAKPR
jgi:hypothetical protein